MSLDSDNRALLNLLTYLRNSFCYIHILFITLLIIILVLSHTMSAVLRFLAEAFRPDKTNDVTFITELLQNYYILLL